MTRVELTKSKSFRESDRGMLSCRNLTLGMLLVAVAACGEAPLLIDETGEPFDDGTSEAEQAALASPIGTAVKYHPGHYYHLPGQNPEVIIANGEFADTPALRGAQIRYSWRQLEPTKDNYNFTLIEQNLNTLKASNLRLVILIQTKSFGATDHVVPDYMKRAWFDGGEFAYGAWNSTNNTIKGYNLALWNTNVRARLTKLINQLGIRFNNETHFEGLGLVETAVGKPIGTVPNFSESKFYSNLLAVNKSMRTAFPNTVTFQFMNYPASILESFIAGAGGLQSFAGGLGGPDVWLQDPGVNGPGHVYSYYDRMRHVIPLLPSIMPGNYKNTRHDGTGYQPQISELLTDARDDLHANYLFWTRVSKAGDPGYYTSVLNELNKPAQTQDAAGGLDATCPSRYPSCFKN